MNNGQRVQIDPETFAYHVMDMMSVDGDQLREDAEAVSKEALATYLSAYFLAERFNSTENEFFVDKDSQGIKSSYQRILSELNQY